MLELSDLRRGDTFCPDYVGTIVEVVDEIPESAKCPDFREIPGALIYWHFMDSSQSTKEGIYPHALPTSATLDKSFDPGENLQWLPLVMLRKYPIEAFPRLAGVA